MGLIDNVFFPWAAGYVDTEGVVWKLDNKSSVGFGNDIVGIPKIITFKDRYGTLCTMNLVTWPIKINLEDLHELDPDRFPILQRYEYNRDLECLYKIDYINIYDKEKVISKSEMDIEDIEEMISANPEEFPRGQKYEYDQYSDCACKIDYVSIGDYEKEISRCKLDSSDEHFSETLATFLAEVSMGIKSIDYYEDDVYLRYAMQHNRCCTIGRDKMKDVKDIFKKNIEDLNVKGLYDIDKYIYEYFMV